MHEREHARTDRGRRGDGKILCVRATCDLQSSSVKRPMQQSVQPRAVLAGIFVHSVFSARAVRAMRVVRAACALRVWVNAGTSELASPASLAKERKKSGSSASR